MRRRPDHRSAAYTGLVEKHVKERLVGAAVLVALAVILIPELLSGPGPERKRTAPTSSPNAEQGVKTYQFDLNEPGSSNGQFTSTPAPPSEQAPESEISKPAAAESEPPSNAPASEAAAAAKNPPLEQEPAERPRSIQPSTSVSAPAPPIAPIAAASNSANTPGWAVQLGSFADHARATQLVQRMQAAGHQSYLVPLKRADGKVLQRVRIGPYSQRDAAEAALKQVAAEAKGAAVVSQP
jgi:DedD protein